ASLRRELPALRCLAGIACAAVPKRGAHPQLSGAGRAAGEHRRAGHERCLSRGAEEVSLSLKEVRGVIFDVDGVLLDARPSYHAAAEEAARRAIAPLVGEAAARAVAFDRSREIPAFKAAGRFNDDWETARGVALLLLLRARGEAPPL